MRAFSSMPTEDFVYQLRTIAINAKASPLVIDQIDAIVAAPSEEEIDERIAEAVREAERGADEMADEAESRGFASCVEVIESLRHSDPDNIGLTDTQIDQILAAFAEMAP